MAENDDIKSRSEKEENEVPSGHSEYKIPDVHDKAVRHQLSGMFQDWFLDYASYVILDRAVPHLCDGLKPVQRRILHAMREKEDGRYNKVANLVGHTMQYHPHGDASIGDALVQLGQKELLIDCQGNWGNVLTGDSAAAPRYIEARLSRFALEVVFNKKTTEWKMSYDGRNQEPVALPVKFPLVLAQGAEGIGVGLSTKILPHNFNELLDASIAYLKGEDVTLYPDFSTGGLIDVSKYNDGRRGGLLRIRARINKVDAKTLCITEIPYGTTVGGIEESILKANEKGKIQVRKVVDNTASQAEIMIFLPPGRSPDKTIDALYAFTDCQVSVSPNCCVIYEDKPCFMSVSEVLRFSVDNTVRLLKEELLIEKAELQEAIFYASLEKIFIEQRIYKEKEYEEAGSTDEAVAHISKRLQPFLPQLLRPVETDDILKLLEIRMKRILRFSSDEADAQIATLQERLQQASYRLEHIVEHAIQWYAHLKDKYGAAWPRRTELRNFDNIEATKVLEANEKLYINEEEGFIGTSLKHDKWVCNCSSMDDVVVFYKDGKVKVVKVAEKLYVGKNVLYVGLFKKGDNRTIYNMIYRDGKDGFSYIKRFAMGGVARDKEYDLTPGKPGTRVLYFSANPNGEAETVRISLKPKPRLKSLSIERDFKEVNIKGRSAMGNICTKYDILRIQLKNRGSSTLGGREVWFDADVQRLNYDGRGTLLGEFRSEDTILVLTQRGIYQLSNFDLSNHYPTDLIRIEKYDARKVWTAVVYDGEQKQVYVKRFLLEATLREQSFSSEHPSSRLLYLTDTPYPRLELHYEGKGKTPISQEIEAEEFVPVRSSKARGRKLGVEKLTEVVELEPLRFPDPDAEIEENLPEDNPTLATPISPEPSEDSEPAPEPRLDEDGQFSLF